MSRNQNKNVLLFDALGAVADSLIQSRDAKGSVVVIFKEDGTIQTGVRGVKFDELRLALNWVIHESFVYQEAQDADDEEDLIS